MMSKAFQQTRHARRLYVGGLPAISDDEVRSFFDQTIALGLRERAGSQYVLSVYIDRKKAFVFVELTSLALTIACLNLDGLMYKNIQLKILRANEFKPELLREHMEYFKEAPVRFDVSLAFGQHRNSNSSPLIIDGYSVSSEMKRNSSNPNGHFKKMTSPHEMGGASPSSQISALTEKQDSVYYRPNGGSGGGGGVGSHRYGGMGMGMGMKEEINEYGYIGIKEEGRNEYGYIGQKEERNEYGYGQTPLPIEKFINSASSALNFGASPSDGRMEAANSYYEKPQGFLGGATQMSFDSEEYFATLDKKTHSHPHSDTSISPRSISFQSRQPDSYQSFYNSIKPRSVGDLSTNSITLIGFPIDVEGIGESYLMQHEIRKLFLKDFRSALKETSHSISNPEFDINFAEDIGIFDVGNVELPKSYKLSRSEFQTQVNSNFKNNVLDIVEAGSIPFVVGGSFGQFYVASLGLLDIRGGNKTYQTDTYQSRYLGDADFAGGKMENEMDNEMEKISFLHISASLEGSDLMLKLIDGDKPHPYGDESAPIFPPGIKSKSPPRYTRFGVQGVRSSGQQARRLEATDGCEIVWYSKNIRGGKAPPLVEQFRKCIDSLSDPLLSTTGFFGCSLDENTRVSGGRERGRGGRGGRGRGGERRKVAISLDPNVISQAELGVERVNSLGLTVEEVRAMVKIAGAHSDVILFDISTETTSKETSSSFHRHFESNPVKSSALMVELFYTFCEGFAQRSLKA